MRNQQRKRTTKPRSRVKKAGLRNRTQEIPYNFNIKLFVTLGVLLIILIMKKYSLSVGNFNIDSLYNVVYYNEDINTLKSKVFFFKNRNSNESDGIIDLDKENDSDIIIPEPNINEEDINNVTDE